MNRNALLTATGIGIAVLLSGCKSRYEKLGDEYLEKNQPLYALQHYDKVRLKGNGSKEFHGNLVRANILAMKQRSLEDATAEFVGDYKDTISALLLQQPDAQAEAEFGKALVEIAKSQLGAGRRDAEEMGFRFLGKADSLANLPADVRAQVAQLRTDFTKARLAQIEENYETGKGGDSEYLILADYEMSFLELLHGQETPEMAELWSKIRKANLDNYLMYDHETVQAVLGTIDARINKYGVLLGITKYQPGRGNVYLEVTAFNGANNPMTFNGDNFELVDRNGNRYKPASKRGGFNAKKHYDRSIVTPPGGLSFKVPSDAKPHYVEFASEVGISRKYLP